MNDRGTNDRGTVAADARTYVERGQRHRPGMTAADRTELAAAEHVVEVCAWQLLYTVDAGRMTEADARAELAAAKARLDDVRARLEIGTGHPA